MCEQGRLLQNYPKTGLALPLEMRVILCRQRRMTTRRDALWGIVVSLNLHYNQPVSTIIFRVSVFIDKCAAIYVYQRLGTPTKGCYIFVLLRLSNYHHELFVT